MMVLRIKDKGLKDEILGTKILETKMPKTRDFYFRIIFLYLKILTALVILTEVNLTLAKDLGNHGTTFEIKESDLLEFIEGRLTAMEKNGEMEIHQERLQQKYVERIEEPSRVKGISKVDVTREFTFDPTKVLDKDILDSNGNIIAVKGTKVNPLEHITYDKKLIFIDGSDKAQVKWLEKTKGSPRKIILTAGRPLDLEEQLDEEVYFDQQGALTKEFGILAVPAIAWQEGQVFKVREEKVEE